MTGNLSRTVLRGAGARESACLPDLTNNETFPQFKKRKTTFLLEGRFSLLVSYSLM